MINATILLFVLTVAFTVTFSDLAPRKISLSAPTLPFCSDIMQCVFAFTNLPISVYSTNLSSSVCFIFGRLRLLASSEPPPPLSMQQQVLRRPNTAPLSFQQILSIVDYR